MASIVKRQEENQILHRVSWLEGRGFRYLECSPILDVRTHLRNDVEEEKKDDDDDTGYDNTFFLTVGTPTIVTLRSRDWLMLISFISPMIFPMLIAQ